MRKSWERDYLAQHPEQKDLIKHFKRVYRLKRVSVRSGSAQLYFELLKLAKEKGVI